MKNLIWPLLLLISGWQWTAEVHGQANLKILIARTNNTFQVSWPVRSMVPLPGVQMFAAYEVKVSSNLVEWHGQGERIGGPPLANKTARVSVTNETQNLFVKVESILDFHGAELIGVLLQN